MEELIILLFGFILLVLTGFAIFMCINGESQDFKQDCLEHGWYYYKLGNTGYCDSDGSGP